MEGERTTEKTHLWAQCHREEADWPEDPLRAGAHSWAVLVFGFTQLTQVTQEDRLVLLNIAAEGRSPL